MGNKKPAGLIRGSQVAEGDLFRTQTGLFQVGKGGKAREIKAGKGMPRILGGKEGRELHLRHERSKLTGSRIGNVQQSLLATDMGIRTGKTVGSILLPVILVLGGITAFGVLFTAIPWWGWLLTIFGLLVVIRRLN